MDLTIGQISTFLAFLVGFISSIVYLSKIIQKIVKKTLEPINKNINIIEIDWVKILGIAGTTALVSILMSITGLPEVKEK